MLKKNNTFRALIKPKLYRMETLFSVKMFDPKLFIVLASPGSNSLKERYLVIVYVRKSVFSYLKNNSIAY